MIVSIELHDVAKQFNLKITESLEECGYYCLVSAASQNDCLENQALNKEQNEWNLVYPHWRFLLHSYDYGGVMETMWFWHWYKPRHVCQIIRNLRSPKTDNYYCIMFLCDIPFSNFHRNTVTAEFGKGLKRVIWQRIRNVFTYIATYTNILAQLALWKIIYEVITEKVQWDF